MAWHKYRIAVCRKHREDFGTVVEVADSDDVAKPDRRIVIGRATDLAQSLLPNLDRLKSDDYEHHQRKLNHYTQHYSD